MKIVISIGGSVLAKELNPDTFRNYASAFRKIAKDHTLFIVTGGGKAAREYIKAARELGASEAVSDDIGIEVTRLNARLLIAALGDDAYHEPPETYRKAIEAGITGKIVVMGGVVPGQTTDAVSAVIAEYTGAELLINATATDGVYTHDPKKYSDAKKFDSMTPKQLIELVARTEMTAGANLPVDILASKIIERSGIRTVVLKGEKPEDIVDAVRGKHSGTVIEG